MGKKVDSSVLDGAFNVIKSNAGTITQTLCSAEPANYAGISAVALASTTINKTTELTLANGDTSGRKMTVSAKSGVSVSASGTGNHVTLSDGTTLLYVTTTTSTAVASGGTVDIGSWKAEIGAPA